jgi:hypothetical protein
MLGLDKTQVARRHLGTALALFLNDDDPVSVHTLAAAGGEIAEHLAIKAGQSPFISHIQKTFPDLDIKAIRGAQRQHSNAFKHALANSGVERNDQDLFEKFTDEYNDHVLFVGWHDYMIATGILPVEVQVFQVWYYALYPEKLASALDAEIEEVFPDLKANSREVQKIRLRDAINVYRNDEGLMRDAQTDQAPLIIRP